MTDLEIWLRDNIASWSKRPTFIRCLVRISAETKIILNESFLGLPQSLQADVEIIH
jgi:hypothetical protein